MYGPAASRAIENTRSAAAPTESGQHGPGSEGQWAPRDPPLPTRANSVAWFHLALALHYARGNMNTIKLFALASITSLVVACGGGGADFKKLKEEACACKDKACAEAVNKKLDAAIEGLAKGGEKEAEKALEKVGPDLAEAGACLGKLGLKAGE